jgi:hypothetical protein
MAWIAQMTPSGIGIAGATFQITRTSSKPIVKPMVIQRKQARCDRIAAKSIEHPSATRIGTEIRSEDV